MLSSVSHTLASPRLMAAFFVLMAAAALGVAYGAINPTPAALLPLGLLVLNLAASIASNARFRADLPLLVFHLSLLAFVALLAAARLTYFEGIAMVPVGSSFSGELVNEERGPLHGTGARALRFSNLGFTEIYKERKVYRHTSNQVRFVDDAGNAHEGEIGNDRPLVLDGYRIYTIGNRGFAPVLQWMPEHDAIQITTVTLGPVGEDGYTPGVEFSPPGGPQLWVSLSTEHDNPAPGSVRKNLGAESAPNKLVLRLDGPAHHLQKGESIALPGGQLTYAGLSAWMGYRIVYDPTKPWLLGTVAVAVGSLIWFYARRLWRTWDED